jgi:HSP20 family molecular chaperone IbpA
MARQVQLPLREISLGAKQMPSIVIPAKPANGAEKTILRKVEELVKQTENLAYRLFEMRGKLHGQALDDWLQAEKELFIKPAVDIQETPKEVRAKISLPELEAKDLNVEASPHTVLIEGKARAGKKEASREWKTLLEWVTLPHPIDPKDVKVEMARGVLTVVARKDPANQRSTLDPAAA